MNTIHPGLAALRSLVPWSTERHNLVVKWCNSLDSGNFGTAEVISDLEKLGVEAKNIRIGEVTDIWDFVQSI